MTATSTSMTRVALLACAAALATVTVSAPSASADGSHAAPTGGGRKPDRCVTMGEYDKVDVHQTRSSVHRRFGTSGHRTSIAQDGPRTDEVRQYDVCDSPDSSVTVSYRKVGHGPFKVVSKTAVFVG
jgi:hypothetical protein